MSLYGISLTFFLSMNDIDHSIRNTSLLGHLHEQHCRPRVLLTRLNNVRVATHESHWEHLKGRRGGVNLSLSLSLSLPSYICVHIHVYDSIQVYADHTCTYIMYIVYTSTELASIDSHMVYTANAAKICYHSTIHSDS